MPMDGAETCRFNEWLARNGYKHVFMTIPDYYFFPAPLLSL
jgi:hypothetical protein